MAMHKPKNNALVECLIFCSLIALVAGNAAELKYSNAVMPWSVDAGGSSVGQRRDDRGGRQDLSH